jgi:hypothetical protein
MTEPIISANLKGPSNGSVASFGTRRPVYGPLRQKYFDEANVSLL